jgi:hypothetical protein
MYKIFNITEKEFLLDSKTFEHIILNKEKAKLIKYVYAKLTAQKFKLVKIE